MALDVATLAVTLDTTGIPEAVTQATQYRDALQGIAPAAQGTGQQLDGLGQKTRQQTQEHKDGKSSADAHAGSLKQVGEAAGIMGGALGQAGVPMRELSGLATELRAKFGELSEGGLSAAQALGLAGTAVAGVGLIAAGEAAKGFVELTDRIHETSEMTGQSAATIQAFGYGMQTIGQSADSGVRALTLFQRNAGQISDQLEKGVEPSGKFAESLTKLGISAEQFVSMRPDERLRAVMDAFSTSGESINKTQVAMDLFGRQGASMIGILEAGGASLDQWGRRVSESGAGVDQAWPKVQKYHEATAQLGVTMQGLEVQLGSALLPRITAVTSAVAGGVTAVERLPGPVLAGAAAMGVLAVGATAVVPAVTAAAAAMATFAAANPVLLGTLVAVGAAVAAGTLIYQHMTASTAEATQAQREYNAALKEHEGPAAAELAALKEAGQTQEQVAAHASEKVATLSRDYEQLISTITFYVGGLGIHNQMTQKQSDALAATDPKYAELRGNLLATGASLGVWQRAQKDSADQAEAAAIKVDLNAQAVKKLAEANQFGGLEATTSAHAHDLLDQAIQKSGKSTQDAKAFQDQFKDAVAFAKLPLNEQKDVLEELAQVQKTGDENAKAAASSQKSLDEAVKTLTPDVAEAVLHTHELNDAWSKVTQNGGDVPGMLREWQNELNNTSTSVHVLQQHFLDLAHPPTQEELDLKARIADLNAQVKDFDNTLANDSPALQHVAAMQKAYDQAQITGQSLKAQQKAKEDLDRALADTGPAGADVAAQQHRVDILDRSKAGLEGQLGSLEAHRAAMTANTTATEGNALHYGDLVRAYESGGTTISSTGSQVALASQGVATSFNNTATSVEGSTGRMVTATENAATRIDTLGAQIGRSVSGAANAIAGAVHGMQSGAGGAAVTPAAQPGGRSLILPTDQGQITQYFGPTNVPGEPLHNGQLFHEGLDINAQAGTQLRAAGGGIVQSVVDYGGTHTGLTVTLDLGGGLTEILGHLSHSEFPVGSSGQRVEQGQVVAESGYSGYVLPAGPGGAHVHVQFNQGGVPVDPLALTGGATSPVVAQAAAAGAAAGVAAAGTAFGGGMLPPSWYAAIQANESTLPLPAPGSPQPMFGFIGGRHAVGEGIYSSGGTPEASASLGVGAGQTRQALFPTVQAGMQQFDETWQNMPGAAAAVAAGDFPAFLQALVAGGYAGPGEGARWPGQVLSHFTPGGAGGTAAATGVGGDTTGSDFGTLPSPAPEAAGTPLTPEQRQSAAESAQSSIDQLGRQAGTVTTGVKQQINEVTQAQLDAARTLQESDAAIAHTKISEAQRANQAVIDDVNNGATPAQLKADQTVAASAQKAANDAIADWSTANSDFQTLAQRYAATWDQAYTQQTASMQAHLQQQQAMQQTQAQRNDILGVTEVVTHRAVNAQTLASDQATVDARQATALKANDDLQTANQNLADASNALNDAKAANADAATQAMLEHAVNRDQAIVASAQNAANQQVTAYHTAVQQQQQDRQEDTKQNDQAIALSTDKAKQAALVKIAGIQGITEAARAALREQVQMDFAGADSGVAEYHRLTDELAKYYLARADLENQIRNSHDAAETAMLEQSLKTLNAWIDGEERKRDEIVRTANTQVSEATRAADAQVAAAPTLAGNRPPGIAGPGGAGGSGGPAGGPGGYPSLLQLLGGYVDAGMLSDNSVLFRQIGLSEVPGYRTQDINARMLGLGQEAASRSWVPSTATQQQRDQIAADLAGVFGGQRGGGWADIQRILAEIAAQAKAQTQTQSSQLTTQQQQQQQLSTIANNTRGLEGTTVRGIVADLELMQRLV